MDTVSVCVDLVYKMIDDDYSLIMVTQLIIAPDRTPGAIMGMNFGVIEHVSGYHNLLPYPNPGDYSLVLTKAILRGQRSGLRGIVPGLYLTPHYRPLPAGSVVKNVPSLPGQEFLCFDICVDSSATLGQFYIDLTGPWRAQ